MYFYKENRQFCYYSRGPLLETKCWFIKVFNRKLIEEKDYLTFANKLETMGIKLNNYKKPSAIRMTINDLIIQMTTNDNN